MYPACRVARQQGMTAIQPCTNCLDIRPRRYGWLHQSNTDHYEQAGEWYCLDCARGLIPYNVTPTEQWLLYENGVDRPIAAVGIVTNSSIGSASEARR